MSKAPPPIKPKPKIPPPITSKKPILNVSSSSSPSSFATNTLVTESLKKSMDHFNDSDNTNAIGNISSSLRKVNADLPVVQQTNPEHYDSSKKSIASTARLPGTSPIKNASLFSVPITMSMADFSEDENDENNVEAETNQLSPKPSKLNYGSNSFSTKTVSAFPPPPKHRSSSNVRREESEEFEERKKASERPPTLPLRRNEKSIEKPTSPLKNISPPPRHRSLSKLKKEDESDEEKQQRKLYDDDENPPSLPARHSVQKNLAKMTLDSKDASESSTRATTRRIESSRNHIYEDKDEEKYQEYGRRPKNRSHSRLKHNSSRHGQSSSRKSSHVESSYSSDESYSDNSDDGKSSLRRDSSTLLSSAKVLSKNSYHSAKEKSGPLARQAMGGLSKMKNRLKNSGSSLNMSRAREEEDDDDDEVADNDEEYEIEDRNGHETKHYRRRKERGSSEDYESSECHRRRYTPERPSRLSGLNRSETPEIPRRSDRSERPENLLESTCPSISPAKDEAYVEEDSIDEDRPPLPTRKAAIGPSSIGTPLPGLSVIKPKPDVSSKPKPAIPPKKKSLEQAPRREIFLKQDVQIRNVTPPRAPPSRSGPPPPPPTRARPQAPPSRSIRSSSSTRPTAWKEPDLDLELPTCWFVNNDPSSLPACFKGLDYQSSFGYVGKKQFKIYAFRWKDLSTVRLKLVWLKDSGTPLDTLTHDIKIIPPPPVTKTQLLQGHEKYGEHVANWCEVKEGSKVGDGECWTLAHDALEKGCGKYAFISSGLNHGALIVTFKGINADSLPTIIKPSVSDEIRRGDILQFKSCFFKYPNETQTFGSPNHTAIVLDSSPSDDDKNYLKLTIIQQNFNGHKIVSVSEIEIDKLAGGELKVYRPVDADWIPDLSEVVI